jgi:hypothetical protein
MASKRIYRQQKEMLILAGEMYLKVLREDERRQKKGLPPMVSDPDPAVRTRYYDASNKYNEALFFVGPAQIIKAIKETL